MAMERWQQILAVAVFFLLSGIPVAEATTAVNVGVVLNTGTLFAKMRLTSMRMAVDEFYTSHGGYVSRLAIRARDSEATTVGAASAALYLLEDVGVDAVIGTQSSSQAVFVSDLAAESKVPLVSFTATAPSLSAHNPFFVRTTLNDSAQAPALASLVAHFGWREVSLLYEDSEFGSGIVPYLIDALLDAGAPVAHRSLIHPSATSADARAELLKLKDMRTRVFIVHMDQKLGSVLFKEASGLGMMTGGYVWIMTTGITMEMESMDRRVLLGGWMDGVLGLRPCVDANEVFDGFTPRWKRRFRAEYPKIETPDPTVFDLWAYDTVRALAEAAENVSGSSGSGVWRSEGRPNRSITLMNLEVSQAGPKLLDSISQTNFVGVSGKFRLVDRQLEAASFEVINVVGKEIKTVGNWTPSNGISMNLDSRIVWPGGKSEKAPRGWEWPTPGKRLRIGVPKATGFLEFVEVTQDARTNKTKGDGFCIQVFEAAMKNLSYDVPYEYILYADDHGNPNGTYDDLVYQVYLNNFDAVVGDVTIWPNRLLYVDFTTPFTEFGVVMIVAIKDEHESLWGFLEPMTNELWLATAVAFTFTGLVVWLLEHRINKAFAGTILHQFGTVLFFAFSTMVFAHKETIKRNLSRAVLIVWVFVAFVLTSSYTASLSSMLTSQQLQPAFRDANDLIRKGEKVGYLGDSFVKSLLISLGFNEQNLVPLQSQDEYADALSKGSLNNGVAAIFDEIPYVRVFLSTHTSKYTVAGPTYKTDGFGFVFPRGSLLVSDVSRAILQVKEGNDMFKFEEKLYGYMANAPLSSFGKQGVNNRLPFKRFSGPFLITGITSTMALMLHLAIGYWKKRRGVNNNRSKYQSIMDRINLLLHGRKILALEATTGTPAEILQNANSSFPPRTIDAPESPPDSSCHTYPNLEEVPEPSYSESSDLNMNREVDEEIP